MINVPGGCAERRGCQPHGAATSHPLYLHLYILHKNMCANIYFMASRLMLFILHNHNFVNFRFLHKKSCYYYSVKYF